MRSLHAILITAAVLSMTGDRAGLAAAESREGSSHWAYAPLRRVELPQVENTDWPRTRIDRFILARLEKENVPPAGDADRTTLCRRVYFDLIGLPPTPEELEAFLADTLPDAFPRLVDRLLASPRFGEHWARHWFDIVRFAESVTLRGFIFKEAWRYRDYVIESFNRDAPLDQFIREQIAGDLLPADTIDERQRLLTATTFLMLGNTNLEEQDKKQLEMDVVDEQLEVIGKAFLGQTISCARCHDHKFDPIPTRDYYALAGILKNSLAIKHDNVSTWIERPLPLEPQLEEAYGRLEAEIGAIQARIKELKAAVQKESQGEEAKREKTEEIARLEAQLKELRTSLPPRPMVMAPREAAQIADIPIHRRGSVHALGELVPRGFLGAAAVADAMPPPPDDSGRRELADWITHPENPLTARVLVNRIWLWLMGEGLVRTPDNFGTTGTPPTHPELLDWLAAGFAGLHFDCAGSAQPAAARAPDPEAIRPWSLKSLVRQIVLSRTYRLSSIPTPEALALDPQNRLFSHAVRKRLTAEQIRDGMLSASGRLQVDFPNGPTFPRDRASDYDFVSTETRRSVYLPWFRNALPEIFTTFDGPSPSSVTGRRNASAVAPQALFMLNHPFVLEQSQAAAGRVADQPGLDVNGRLDRAFLLVLGRPPSQRERQIILEHLEVDAKTSEDQNARWTEVFRALFSSLDFVFLK